MYRSFSHSCLAERIGDNNHLDKGFDVKEWLSNPNNIFIKQNDDYALFEKVKEGIYEGHYLFSEETKGAKALEVATDILEKFFIEYNPNAIRGLVPTRDRKTKWITRQLGFSSLGEISTPDGDCELFLLINPLH